LGLRLD